jgi:hypothetical protein
METIVLDGQSLFDIAVQQAGSVDAAFALAVANNVSVSGEVPASTPLANTPMQNNRIAEYFSMKALKPATDTSSAEGEVKLTGIGYMAIGIDFKVSE